MKHTREEVRADYHEVALPAPELHGDVTRFHKTRTWRDFELNRFNSFSISGTIIDGLLINVRLYAFRRTRERL